MKQVTQKLKSGQMQVFQHSAERKAQRVKQGEATHAKIKIRRNVNA